MNFADFFVHRSAFIIYRFCRCRRVRRADRMKVVVDERQQLLAGSMNYLQIRHEAVLLCLQRLLRQHLGVADDITERRAQVVDQARWQRVPGCFAGWRLRFGHDVGSPAEAISPPLNSASILPSRRGSSMGLVS